MTVRVARRYVNIDQCLVDPNLLGAALGNPASWSTWLAVLRATFGQSLSPSDQTLFANVSGGRAPPTDRVRELWCVVGRRAGKSRIAAALAIYQACFVKYRLSPGEQGYVLTLAASRDQARRVFEYAVAFLRTSPVLAQEVDSITTTEIRLRSGIVIAVHSNSFRTIRGRTLLGVILDEVSFWRDETSALPDIEAYRAILPSLATTNGLLVGISTPYRKLGLLHQKYRNHFGQSSDDVLVVQGKSITFNPLLTESVIAQALTDDPEGNRAEWEGDFRSDLAALLDEQLVEAAVDHSRPLELPVRHGIRYFAFCDPSGGRHDAFTICIGHREGDAFIVDVARGTRPPFDPNEISRQYAFLLKDYRVATVLGDNYSADWVVTAFKDVGIKYQRSDRPKSQLYLEALPLFTRQLITLPDLPPLLRELRLLERQTHRSGKDTVDHGKRGSDDYANAVCGCAVHSMKRKYDSSLAWVDGQSSTDNKSVGWDNDWQRRQLHNFIATGGYRRTVL